MLFLLAGKERLIEKDVCFSLTALLPPNSPCTSCRLSLLPLLFFFCPNYLLHTYAATYERIIQLYQFGHPLALLSHMYIYVHMYHFATASPASCLAARAGLPTVTLVNLSLL